jgi:two-component system nitrogen regulation response regulator NtrX
MTPGADILVVDDDKEIRKTIAEAFEIEGFVVETVATGKQAIKAVKRRMFRVALVDIRLPDMNGIELLDKLTETAGPQMVKIIITDYPDLKSVVEAVNKNADAYIFKPIDIWNLIKVVKKSLSEKTYEYIRTNVPSNQELREKKQKHLLWKH